MGEVIAMDPVHLLLWLLQIFMFLQANKQVGKQSVKWRGEAERSECIGTHLHGEGKSSMGRFKD